MSRSKSDAIERTATAVRLRMEGHTWDEVAAGANYANRGTAYRTVTRALRKQTAADLEAYVTVELERIDLAESALLSIVSTSSSDATKVRALREVLAASRDRAKLLGLYDRAPATESEPRTLFDPALGQLREGNTCRISGSPDCGFEPSEHSRECNKSLLGFVPLADGEASTAETASLPDPSGGEDLLQ